MCLNIVYNVAFSGDKVREKKNKKIDVKVVKGEIPRSSLHILTVKPFCDTGLIIFMASKCFNPVFVFIYIF